MPSPEGEGAPTTGFRVLGERERYDGGFLRLVTGTFVGPDGFTFERDIVRHLGAVCVVPLERDRRHVLLVRQYRAAVGEALLELPAGKLDVTDEPPLECAARELAEEVGQRADHWVELCQFYNSPGFTDERTWCFLAEGLTPCDRSAQGVEEHHLTVERLDLEQTDELISAGAIVDAKTIVGLLAAKARLAHSPGAGQPAAERPSPSITA
jgi:ADP-ribose pyrophosphatase